MISAKVLWWYSDMYIKTATTKHTTTEVMHTDNDEIVLSTMV